MLNEEVIQKIAEARKKYGRVDLTVNLVGSYIIATLNAKDFMLSVVNVFGGITLITRVNELYLELLETLDSTAVQKPVVQIIKHDESVSEVICESCGKPIAGYQGATTFVPASRVIDISQERFASNYCSDCYISAANTRKRKV